MDARVRFPRRGRRTGTHPEDQRGPEALSETASSAVPGTFEQRGDGALVAAGRNHAYDSDLAAAAATQARRGLRGRGAKGRTGVEARRKHRGPARGLSGRESREGVQAG